MYFMECLGKNQDNHLTIGGMDVQALADKYGTPLYIMDEDVIRNNCRIYKHALEKYYNGNGMVLYASKAFSCKHICRVAAAEGMGLDVVSGGELYTALAAGFPPERIYFHGNNKTADELQMAIDRHVGRIVVDNVFELRQLNGLAERAGAVCDILFRIKPGIDAHTHEFIMTGQIDSKFGAAMDNGEADELMQAALAMEHVNIVGIHCHIGSQIFEFEPFLAAAEKMISYLAHLKGKYGLELRELNLGGGYGIKYLETDDPIPFDEYIKNISVRIKERCAAQGLALPKVLMEPGRSLVAPAGITVYTVGAVKHIPDVRTYVSVDGGMCDNPRYILYESKYEALKVNGPDTPKEQTVTIAGKRCESGDIIIRDYEMPAIAPGERIAVLATGAYNYSMASNYNRIPRPPVVTVRGGKDQLIVKRESYEDIIQNDL